MISSNEFTRKMIEATKKGEGYGKIVTDFLQGLLIDMSSRYGMMTDISHPVVAAAFKLHSEMLYSKLDENGKKLCDSIVEGVDGQVQEIRMPIGFKFNKGDKQGDTTGGL